MLARNFKTAEELCIPEELHIALLDVLKLLESDKIKPLSDKAERITFKEWGNPIEFFDMGVVCKEYDCGTAGCLLGLAYAINKKLMCFKWQSRLIAGNTIAKLFVPTNPAAIQCRDPEKGAMALRNFLTIGDPRWEDVVKEKVRK